jgi:hypothetical protein
MRDLIFNTNALRTTFRIGALRTMSASILSFLFDLCFDITPLLCLICEQRGGSRVEPDETRDTVQYYAFSLSFFVCSRDFASHKAMGDFVTEAFFPQIPR